MSRVSHCRIASRSAQGPGAGKLSGLWYLAVVPLLALILPGFIQSQDKESGEKPSVEAVVKVRGDEITVKIVDNPQAFVGQPTRIRLEVTNPNKEDVDRVTVVARLPAQLEHASRGQDLLANLVSLAPNEKLELDLVVVPRQSGKLPIDVNLFTGDIVTANTKIVILVEERPAKFKFVTPINRAELSFDLIEIDNLKSSTLWVATIDGSTPVRELLPPVPQSLLSRPRHLLPDSIEQVTEVAFQEPVRPDREKALNHTRTIASKIMHLHSKKMDSYMEELIAARSDLQGLPFTLGAACRANPERMVHFTTVLSLVRGSMGGEFTQPLTAAVLARREANDSLSDQFWQNFNTNLIPQITAVDRKGRAKSKDLFREAHVAALMQVCGPEQGAMRRGLTRHVAGIATPDSSKALAKLALFSPEEDVRREAIDSLKVRKDKDYSDILIQGLRYPWPEVAKRAAEVIVALERKDLVPALVEVLDEADPRLPRAVEVKGKKSHVVSEMVRMNHHRNCFMCHAPATATDPGAGDILTGAVPIPGEPMPSFQEGYRNSTPELAVRIDVTYLRQDFSVFMKVEGAHPWPEMQRFDFLVRTREVKADEMEAFGKLADDAEEGVISPYHRAAVSALRELTGRDAAPSADAWRRILKLPARGT